MTQDPKNKPSSPAEIEFGDATLIGFNIADGKPIATSNSTPESKATPSIEPQARSMAEPQARSTPEPQARSMAPPPAKNTATATQPTAPAKRSQPVPLIEEDLDRTVVDRSNPLGNPLKEAFDARTIVHSQPKQFNPEETQISPPPKVERAAAHSMIQTTTPTTTPAMTPTTTPTTTPHGANSSAKSPVEKSRVPDSSAAHFPESPTFGHTPIPESLKKASPHNNLLEEAPQPPARSSARKAEHVKERSHDPADMSENVHHAREEESTERQAFSLKRWISKIRSSKTQKFSPQQDDNAYELNEVSGPNELPNHRMRNALIACGAAVLVAVALMKFSHSSDDVGAETPPSADSAQQTQATQTSSASSTAPDKNAAPPPPPNQGQGGANGASAASVASVIQQFDRAFVKTQDQR